MNTATAIFRSVTPAGAGLVAVLLLAPIASVPLTTSAHAWETCQRQVSVVGPEVRGERAAIDAAIASWRREARRLHGRRFASWWYSGDRIVACTWDKRGVRYRCRASALPCG